MGENINIDLQRNKLGESQKPPEQVGGGGVCVSAWGLENFPA